jgi:sulfoxide reductase heme-binding subunit YedZ
MAKKKKNTTTWLKRLTHIGSLAPFVVLVIAFFSNNLTINPIQEATLRTGKTAIIILILSLAVTPIISLTKIHALSPTRRLLGLYAFGYAFVHVLIFFGLDYGFNWPVIIKTMFEKQYTLVGGLAFTLMIPLAITSTKGWQNRLGKRWKKLHKLAYLIGPLTVLHYAWVVKADLRVPLTFGAIVLVLFVLRFPFIKQNFNNKVALQIKNLKINPAKN